MKEILILAVIALLLSSCGGEPVRPIQLGQDPVAIDTLEIGGETAVEDTTAEILVPVSSIEVGNDYLSIVSNTINIDRMGEVRTLSMAFKDGDVTSVTINGEQIGKKTGFQKAPFEWLGNNKIQVGKGATLELIARYYNTTVDQLLVCNQLTSSVIHPGQILKTKCCYACPQ